LPIETRSMIPDRIQCFPKVYVPFRIEAMVPDRIQCFQCFSKVYVLQLKHEKSNARTEQWRTGTR
jgi:hypothetical protein